MPTRGLAFLEVLDADARIVAGTSRPPGARGMSATEAPLELEGQVYGLVRFGVHTEGLEAGLFQVTRNSVLSGALGLVLMVGLTTWLTTHLRALAQALPGFPPDPDAPLTAANTRHHALEPKALASLQAYVQVARRLMDEPAGTAR